MKKVNKKNRIDDLAVDVIDYAFTEWLVRRGVFAAFKANYEANNPSREGFHSALRFHIRAILICPGLDLKHLISSAFPFISTPEGVDFWNNQSVDWKIFCMKLQTNF